MYSGLNVLDVISSYLKRQDGQDVEEGGSDSGAITDLLGPVIGSSSGVSN